MKKLVSAWFPACRFFLGEDVFVFPVIYLLCRQFPDNKKKDRDKTPDFENKIF